MPKDEDVIEVEILQDGLIKAVTDPVSQANHVAAEKFFRLLEGLTGAPQERVKRKESHTHEHTHHHNHQKAKH